MTKNNIRRGMFLLLSCGAVCASAGNIPLSDAETDSLFNLGEVVVTGTRTPKLLKDAPILTRLITSDDIRRADATDLQDILTQELPGVEFSYAMNQQLNMNLAGFAGQNVLVLLNGERIAGETMENTDFSRLTMQNVERIEIVKGAASALYGSNAAGGVVNIITKDVSKPWTANVNVRLADHNEQRYGGTIGFKSGRVGNSIDVTHTTIDTYRLCHDTQDDCDYRTVYGYRTWNVSDRLVYNPMDNVRLSAHLGYYFKERQYNVDMPDRYRDFNGGMRGEWRIGDNDNLELGYNYDQYDKSDYLKLKNLDLRDYRNVQHSTRLLYSHSFAPDNILTVGGDYMRDYLDSYQFNDGARRQYSGDLFAQYDVSIDSNWEVIAAGRMDYFSDNDDVHFTGKAGMRYHTGPFTVRAGYAGGFRAPTMKEKYMRFDMSGFFWIHGNEDLKAETSHGFNASVEYAKAGYSLTLSANYSVVADKISTSTPLTAADDDAYHYVRYINLDRLNVLGMEATAQGRWALAEKSMLGARLAYSYTHEEVRGNTVNQYCPARPHSVNVRVDWDRQQSKWYGFNIALTGRVLSAVDYKSMEMTAPYTQYEVHNPAYSIWKLQLTNRLKDKVRLNIALDNVFNYKPQTYYFNSPATVGTNLMVGVSVDIDKL